MSALLLNGRETAARVRQEIKQQVEAFSAQTGTTPGLAIILIGDDPASQVYVNTKIKACQEAGIDGRLHHFPADAAHEEVAARIQALNDDPRVHGVIVQWPVPAQIDYDALIDALDPRKDVDGFHPHNVGLAVAGRRAHVPATPTGIMQLLAAYDIQVAGRHAVVIGRSRIVGKPMAALLVNNHATVTICHSRTENLADHTRRADLLVVAAGRLHLVDGPMVKPGAVVVDVGMNRTPDGKLAGDVDFASASAVAGAITPVPGGVGPMTVAMLLQNTLDAARWLHGST
ncbi:MAG TPA: bifunctional methylenetetrahydrofolate dehydrogenase/methenyltetrahydrofolate cyclohydrolase FolD [Sphingobacteriaceae bacterium]|nr:bifunctional methylenetetrahydrofolate dehydrogenase/methenyltetrahydrofolate cyclohydrolase FolD [Sphingobacteriaceae bacterium]